MVCANVWIYLCRKVCKAFPQVDQSVSQVLMKAALWKIAQTKMVRPAAIQWPVWIQWTQDQFLRPPDSIDVQDCILVISPMPSLRFCYGWMLHSILVRRPIRWHLWNSISYVRTIFPDCYCKTEENQSKMKCGCGCARFH